jgi:hypothetical protein
MLEDLRVSACKSQKSRCTGIFRQMHRAKFSWAIPMTIMEGGPRVMMRAEKKLVQMDPVN